MAIIISIALALSTPLSVIVLKNISTQADSFHKKCLQLLPKDSIHSESLAALTCGEKITERNLLLNLSKTSLIHIFIVSGSHLILFEQFLGILKMPYFLRFSFLFIYSLAVGWQGPAVRALVGLGLKHLLRQSYCYVPADLAVLATGLMTLFLFPTWWGSLSLQMSWCAALALTIPALLRVRSTVIKACTAQAAILVLMSVPLWGLGSLHPLSIAYNLFLAPLIAFLLLPLSVLTIFIHPAVSLFDGLMTFFTAALPHLADPIQITKNALPASTVIWVWIFLWHLVLHFFRLHLWQGKDLP